jgi:hypothetical protein
MKTTFQSSATNSYHEYGFWFRCQPVQSSNQWSWLNNEFDAMENFSKRFLLDYFRRFVSDKINFSEFEKWANQFRKQYENMGCNTNKNSENNFRSFLFNLYNRPAYLPSNSTT